MLELLRRQAFQPFQVDTVEYRLVHGFFQFLVGVQRQRALCIGGGAHRFIRRQAFA
ncbi:hypothetical protein D1872_350550 [compost metagenome]